MWSPGCRATKRGQGLCRSVEGHAVDATGTYVQDKLVVELRVKGADDRADFTLALRVAERTRLRIDRRARRQSRGSETGSTCTSTAANGSGEQVGRRVEERGVVARGRVQRLLRGRRLTRRERRRVPRVVRLRSHHLRRRRHRRALVRCRVAVRVPAAAEGVLLGKVLLRMLLRAPGVRARARVGKELRVARLVVLAVAAGRGARGAVSVGARSGATRPAHGRTPRVVSEPTVEAAIAALAPEEVACAGTGNDQQRDDDAGDGATRDAARTRVGRARLGGIGAGSSRRHARR